MEAAPLLDAGAVILKPASCCQRLTVPSVSTPQTQGRQAQGGAGARHGHGSGGGAQCLGEQAVCFSAGSCGTSRPRPRLAAHALWDCFLDFLGYKPDASWCEFSPRCCCCPCYGPPPSAQVLRRRAAAPGVADRPGTVVKRPMHTIQLPLQAGLWLTCSLFKHVDVSM